MKHVFCSIAFVLGFWFALHAVANAQPAAVTFRIEVHPITTVDLSTQQVLTGKTDGTERTIAGELRLPLTTETRVPAVIFMHGDAGAVANQPVWIEALNSIGVAVFTVDSFSGRGAVARTTGMMVEGAGLIGSTGRVADAYRALAVLAKHPRIDAQRIALMGVSSGGRVAINSAMTRFAGKFAAPDTAFAAFIALYPNCNVKLDEDTALLPAPLRIHHGAADIITRADVCRSYVERLRKAGRDAEFFEYADALHGYDNPPGLQAMSMPQIPNPSRCQFEERADGKLVNADTEQPVTLSDKCISLGMSGGRNAEAATATQAVVKAFLKSVFKLAP